MQVIPKGEKRSIFAKENNPSKISPYRMKKEKNLPNPIAFNKKWIKISKLLTIITGKMYYNTSCKTHTFFLTLFCKIRYIYHLTLRKLHISIFGNFWKIIWYSIVFSITVKAFSKLCSLSKNTFIIFVY